MKIKEKNDEKNERKKSKKGRIEKASRLLFYHLNNKNRE